MRKNLIEWSDLKYFLAVATEESLSQAAISLGVTHSTVFRRINSLEGDIDVKLFSRNSDGYRLTEVGKEVLQHIRQVAAHIDDLQRLLDNRNNENCGDIYVTAPHNIAYRFLPQYVVKFRQQYPDISINLMVSNKDYNLSRLEADLAIRATSSPPTDLIGRKLFTLQWAAYASKQYIDEHGIPENMSDLSSHYLISANKALSRLPAYQWIENNIPKNNIVIRCNDLTSMSAFAESSVGIALLPDDQAKPSLQRLFEIDKDIETSLWLLIHPDMRQCKRLILFRDFLITAFRDDPLFKEFGIELRTLNKQ